MRRYKMLSGDVIEYEAPAKEVDDYLAQIKVAANNPDISPGELVDLMYSEDNPLLKTGIIPGRGVVTREVSNHPVYHVMLDLLEQKRIQAGVLDREAAESQYTMTVSEAADRLGVSKSAVRQAIQKNKLAGRKVGRRWKLYPESVDAYEVSNRGPNPKRPLSVRMGAIEGLSCRVKMPEHLEDSDKEGGIRTGVLRRWRSVAVIIGGKDIEKVPDRKGYTFWELAPADEENKIEVGPFYLHGPFRVVRKVEHSREALDAYKAFEAR